MGQPAILPSSGEHVLFRHESGAVISRHPGSFALSDGCVFHWIPHGGLLSIAFNTSMTRVLAKQTLELPCCKYPKTHRCYESIVIREVRIYQKFKSFHNNCKVCLPYPSTLKSIMLLMDFRSSIHRKVRGTRPTPG